MLLFYCGYDITSKFYSIYNSENTAMLMTEQELTDETLNNIFEFFGFALVPIFARFLFRFCRPWNPKHSDNSSCRCYGECKGLKCLQGVLASLYVTVCLIVVLRFGKSLYDYYGFVNSNVIIPSDLWNQTAIQQNLEKSNKCDGYTKYLECDDQYESPYGLMGCPSLRREPCWDGYEPIIAQTNCQLMFYLLILQNKAVFESTVLTTFILFDAALYLLIAFSISFIPCCCCHYWFWCTYCGPGQCCVGCCNTNTCKKYVPRAVIGWVDDDSTAYFSGFFSFFFEYFCDTLHQITTHKKNCIVLNPFGENVQMLLQQGHNS